MKKRICIIWNHSTDPKSDIIFIAQDANITEEAVSFLKENWHWSGQQFDDHLDEISVVSIPCIDYPFDARVKAHALYFVPHEHGWLYEHLIEVLDNETVVEALRRQVDIPEACTFEVPDELIEPLAVWHGTPLMSTVINVASYPSVTTTTTAIAYLVFITKEMAFALKTLQLEHRPDEKIHYADLKITKHIELVAQNFRMNVMQIVDFE